MPDAIPRAPQERITLQACLLSAGLFGVVLLLIFHQTTWSMVSIWLRSDTFAHGFLILPISLGLIWNNRDSLVPIEPRPAPWVALLIVLPGFIWLLATLVDVLVIQQLALVAMLVIGVWAILGHQLARALAFPLLFLFLAVPMGEALVPPMMEFTATSTVWLIQQTGVPVYREGLYFTLPSGNWSVVEACSGVRYIIASITLGILYAYLTYRHIWRRALFVVISAIVPVFANSLRAYIIVMLGHWSDMTVATGVDHLIYGWVFFGLVMFLLFWLGSFFREDENETFVERLASTDRQQVPVPASSGRLFGTTLGALLIACIWPWWAHTSEAGRVVADIVIQPSSANSAWDDKALPAWQWQPENVVAGQATAFYVSQGKTLGLFIQYVDHLSPGGDVIGSSTRFGEKHSSMRVIARDRVNAQFGDTTVVVDQAKLLGDSDQLLAWSWYRVGGLYTSNDYVAKFHEAWASLGHGLSGPYRIVIAAPLQESIGSTQALLQGFLDSQGSMLDETLNRSVAEGR